MVNILRYKRKLHCLNMIFYEIERKKLNWACFKLMVNGTLVYLIRPGAKSIDITLKTTVPLDSAQLFTEVF